MAYWLYKRHNPSVQKTAGAEEEIVNEVVQNTGKPITSALTPMVDDVANFLRMRNRGKKKDDKTAVEKTAAEELVHHVNELSTATKDRASEVKTLMTKGNPQARGEHILNSTKETAVAVGHRTQEGFSEAKEKVTGKYRSSLEKMKALFEHGKKTDAAPVKRSDTDGKVVEKAKTEKTASMLKEALPWPKFTWSGGARWPVVAGASAIAGLSAIPAYQSYKKMKWGDLANQPTGSTNWANKVMKEYDRRGDEQEANVSKYLQDNFIPDEFGGYTNPDTGAIGSQRAMNAKLGFIRNKMQTQRDLWLKQQMQSMRRLSQNGHVAIPEQYQTGLDKAFEDFKTKYTEPLNTETEPGLVGYLKQAPSFLKHIIGNPGIYRGTPFLRGWAPETLTEDQLRAKFDAMNPNPKSTLPVT